MNPYGVGYFFGKIFVPLVGAVLAYRLFKSQNKAVRILGAVCGVLAVGYMLSGTLKTVELAQFAAGFREECIAKCGANTTACGTYCACTVKALSELPEAEKLIHSFKDIANDAESTPAQRAQLASLGAECMTPELYDEHFQTACEEECEGAHCSTLCGCILAELREGQEVIAGTRWLMQNVEVEPPTERGQERLTRAITSCSPTDGAAQ